MTFFEWFLFFLVLIVPFIATIFLKREKLTSVAGRTYFYSILIDTGLILLAGAVPLVLDTRSFTAGLMKTSFSEIIIFTIFLAWLLKAVEESRLNLRHSPIALFVLIILWSCIISFFTSSFKFASIKEMFRIFSYGMLFFVIANEVDSRARIQRILSVLLVSGAVVAIYGLAQSLGYDFISWESTGRAVSFIGNPNFLGGFLIMIIPLCISALLISKSWLYRLLYFIVFLVLVLCLMRTFTRTSIIALFAGFLLYVVLNLLKQGPSGTFSKPFIPIVLTGVAAGIFIIFIFTPGLQLLKTKSKNIIPSARIILKEAPEFIFRPYGFKTNATENIGVRITIWQTAYRMFLSRPLFGWGVGTLVYNAPLHRPSFYKLKGFGRANIVEHAHSEYFEILAEQGLVGILAFLGLIASFFVYSVKKLKCLNRDDFYLVSGGICAVFCCLVDNTASVNLRISSTGVTFWLLVGIMNRITMGFDGDRHGHQYQGFLEHQEERAPASLMHAGKHLNLKFLSVLLIILVGIFLWISALKPLFADLHLGRVTKVLKKYGPPEASLRECEVALMYEPTNVDALFLIGNIYASHGRWKEARIAYENVARFSPFRGQLDYNLGLAYFNTGLPEKAINSFRIATEIDSTDYMAYQMLGLCYTVSADWQRSLEAFKKASEAKREIAALEGNDPFFLDAFYNMGTAYYKLGEKREAIEIYDKISKIAPHDTATLEMLSLIRAGKDLK